MCSSEQVRGGWSPRALAEAEPGPEMVAALDTLVLDELSSDDRLWVLEAWERVNAWTAARTHQAVASFVGPADPSGREPARDELAAAMRWGRGAAQTRIDHARQLSEVLPGV